MQNQNTLFNLIEQGKVNGFTSVPKKIETVISRVFIFEKEQKVLKFYKRDCQWWNESMNDISQGENRINFISNDFSFNNFLNPTIYSSLKSTIISDDRVDFIDQIDGDDELVIIMNQEDLSNVFTNVLWENKNSPDFFYNIGKKFAEVKLMLPKKFLPDSKKNWYEQMKDRLSDLGVWIYSDQDFDQNLASRCLKYLNEVTESKKSNFEQIENVELSVLIDCISENLISNSSDLSFIDAFPPKSEWRSGTFDIDIYRVAADIYASSGKDSYEQYISGVSSVAKDKLDESLSHFYLLYGSLIMAPYFFMLSKKNEKYLSVAHRYQDFLKTISQSL